jgi:hypothetical protein
MYDVEKAVRELEAKPFPAAKTGSLKSNGMVSESSRMWINKEFGFLIGERMSEHIIILKSRM